MVIGEAEGEVRTTFENKAAEMNAPITFASDYSTIQNAHCENGHCHINSSTYGTLINELGGEYQIKNSATVLTALQALKDGGIQISDDAVKAGFSHVIENTGLIGRWQTISTNPRIICDSGHNVGAFTQITHQLRNENYDTLHMVMGFMADKDVDHVLAMLPKDAIYYFTQADSPRAMTADELHQKATSHGLHGKSYPTVTEAKSAAITAATTTDLIYIGGSMHILAEALKTDLD